MLLLILCLVAGPACFLLGYEQGKRRGRSELDKIVADIGRLFRDLAAQFRGDAPKN
jgi:hypothetical protein